MKLADVWPLVKDAAIGFWNDKGPRLGAALAFYIALSLSPLLLVVIAIAGAAFGEDAARGEVAHQIQDLVGEDGAKAIQSMLASQHSSGTGILWTIVGIVTLVIGASGVFAQLQEALDTVWNVKTEDVKGGIWATVKDRIMSFSVVCGMAFLLLVSLVFSAALSALNGWMESKLPIGGWGLRIGNHLLSFLLTAAMFAIVYKVLPHANPSWSDVAIGALVTAALFTLGKYLIGLYLGRAAPGSAYGAAGSFVVLLIWIYYSTQILLFGAELTQVYANRFGSGLNRDLRDPPASDSNAPDRTEAQPAVAAAG
jgi:membrane protein